MVDKVKGARPADKRIGLKIKMLRLQIGMSQQTLGKALGVTFQQVQKYEKGVNRVGGSRLVDLAKALDVPVSAFFEAADERGATVSVFDEFLATPGAVDIAKGFMAMESKDRQHISRLVARLAELSHAPN